MRALLASIFIGCVVASVACGGDEPADGGNHDDNSSSSGSSSGRSSSSSSGGSSSGGSSSSGGASSSSSSSGGASSSSGGGSSSGGSSGTQWPGPSGTAITAAVISGIDDLTEELAAHSVASDADDGSFAVLFLSYPALPTVAGAVHVQKHAADGTLIWKKKLEFDPTISYTSLAMDAAGNVYVAVNVAPSRGLTIVNAPAADEHIVNVREAEVATDVGDCAVLRFDAATGAKAWHAQITLRAGLTLGGDVSTQCRGLAVRDDQLVVTGVYPTRDIFYVQGAATTSAVGTQSDASGDVTTSFAISVSASTGVKNTVSTLLNGGAGEWSTDGTAIGTDGRALIHGLALGTNVKVNTTGTGPLLFTPGGLAQRDPVFFPAAFLDLRGAPVTGAVRGAETYAAGVLEPGAFYPQVVALPNANALFGIVLTTNLATTYRSVNAGPDVVLAPGRSYFVLSQSDGDSAGQTRALDLGEPSDFPQHFLGAGSDGSVAIVGTHDSAVDFGVDCDTTTLGAAGGYLVSLANSPLAGCKFAIALPAGVFPSRVSIGADGRLFVVGLYTQAVTFAPNVTLPAPPGAYAPFFVSFVP